LSFQKSSEFSDKAYEKFNNFYGNKLRLHNIVQLKEENYQEGFLREFFVNVLGYTISPDVNFNLTTEYKNQTDNKKADGAILINGQASGFDVIIGNPPYVDSEAMSKFNIRDREFISKNYRTAKGN